MFSIKSLLGGKKEEPIKEETPEFSGEIFKVIINRHSKKAESFDVPVPVWIKNNKAFLCDYLGYANGRKDAIGLAATQTIHKGKDITGRFFAYRRKKDSDHPMELVIDPQIVEKCGEETMETEGCLSWPGKVIIAPRYLKIKVSYYDINGEFHTKTLNRLESQVWQHEVSHLDGINEEFAPDPHTFKRESPKIGRNDPCLCGSGKKFKKCCGVE